MVLNSPPASMINNAMPAKHLPAYPLNQENKRSGPNNLSSTLHLAQSNNILSRFPLEKRNSPIFLVPLQMENAYACP